MRNGFSESFGAVLEREIARLHAQAGFIEHFLAQHCIKKVRRPSRPVQNPAPITGATAASNLFDVLPEVRPVLLSVPPILLPVPPGRQPLDHYDIGESPSECGCRYCVDYFAARRQAEDLAAKVANDDCMCPMCLTWRATRRRKLQPKHADDCRCQDCVRYHYARRVLQTAAANRRDLWTEMSFHAAHFGKPGEDLMAWLATEIAASGRSAGWWANESGRLPLAWWRRRFEAHMSALTSGAFRLVVAVTGTYFRESYMSSVSVLEQLGIMTQDCMESGPEYLLQDLSETAADSASA